MKTALLIVCLLGASAAFGQIGGTISGEPQPLVLSGHPAHASQRPMAEPQVVLENYSGFTHAQGVRPLWEVAPVVDEVPLGDSARILKKQHDEAKRAEIVWVN
jgi:hypothetical protein